MVQPSGTFPYLARAIVKYKSPHKQDLAFAKGETIKVTGAAPKGADSEDDDDDDDDDWLIGESMDGARAGTFPGSFVAFIEESVPTGEDPGAIPAAIPTELQSSVLEEEASTHQAPIMPAAAIEKAKDGVAEVSGFGAPLPPRPASPDALQQPAAQEAAPPEDTNQARPKPSTSQLAAGEAAVISSVGQSPLQSGASPLKSPPSISTKPANMSSSFRDRLAAFNKPAEAAPPLLPKSKPSGWKRPTPSNEAPILSPSSSKPTALAIPKTPQREQAVSPVSPSTSSADDAASAGFSAADAQSSIKMSLKERMAALQRNESAASDSAPEVRSKSSIPGRIGADKRNVAMQGMGLAPPSVLARKLSTDSIGKPVTDQAEPPLLAAEDDASVPHESVEETEDNNAEPTENAGESKQEDQSESELETERRAAIAKRMAALGARRMGGGPAGFGPRVAPAPSKSELEASGGTTAEPGIAIVQSPPSDQVVSDSAHFSPSAELQADVASHTAVDEPKILSVPRRTAAPRKKRTAPVAKADASEPSVEEASAQDEGHTAVGPTKEGIAAAEAAAVAMDTSVSNSAAAPESDMDEAGVSREQDTDEQRTVSNGDVEENLEPTHLAEASDERAPSKEDDLEQAPALSRASTTQDVAGDSSPVETESEMAEHQRQLEEYLRGEGFYDNAVANGSAPKIADDVAEVASDHRNVLASEDDDDFEPLKSSSRNSMRPPVPRTSLPPPPLEAHREEVDRRIESSALAEKTSVLQRGSSIPPVPRTRSTAPEEDGGSTELRMDQASNDGDKDEGGRVLAAPKARMAMPTADPDDEQILAAADEALEAQVQPNDADQVTAEPEELTEEEQESQRRANLARRMAALGGQRIGAFPGMAPPPIMGAPMPFRALPKSSDEAMDKSVTDSEALDEKELHDDGHIDSEPQEEAMLGEPDALNTLSSPSVKPMSPPPPARAPPSIASPSLPPVLPLGRPSSTAPMYSVPDPRSTDSEAPGMSARRTSRPPVPQLRETATSDQDEDSYEGGVASPPLPPTSPPPRPPSRAPPLPILSQPAGPRRQASTASSSSAKGAIGSSAIPERTETPVAKTDSIIPTSTSSRSVASEAKQSPRDLDLMPSSRWWRHGLAPLRLPQTIIGRPDAILYTDTSHQDDAGQNVHYASVHMLFEDYSTTVISLSFVDDDADETHTRLSQAHGFPPNKPTVDMLKQWSSSVGSAIAKMATDFCKQASSPIADGSARGFVQAIIGSIPQALPSVGLSLGATILVQVGPTVMERQADEVRPGDIISCSQADFRGKKGLAPYHMTFGTQAEPAYAIVVECEIKKNKLRCILQSPNNKKGLPDEVSLRLDDLKSGVVKIYRVPPRQGWIQGW